MYTKIYKKMHIDILNLVRTAHTCSAMYVNTHTVQTCLCLFPWFIKLYIQ